MTPRSATTEVRIGISGWTYAPWRGDFYPKGLAHRRELEYASERLTSIEINGTFYAMQKPTSFVKWRDETPSDFVFSVKGGRYITHLKRLVGVEPALANFFATGVLGLGSKLGPVLWQLPPNLQFDADTLANFFELLPRTMSEAVALADKRDDKLTDDRVALGYDVDRPIRYALEVRHESFACAEAIELVRAHDVAFVVADTAGRYPFVETPTSNFIYARLHGDKELYASGYDDAALDVWAERVRAWTSAGMDVFAYFDNDMKGYAPYDAMRLIERVDLSTKI
ncbi:DUF72 domain-containing protein [Rhodococcus sp. BP-252]|uniref:DUF72 domain-containing protein n=1 Tax=unclassified Rhodococcus (in: high G+C Gram-positive bacteria) TaxID=192944 RepID=UPI001C9B1640|nr:MULTISPECIES: DUF72 domain-containing protein [unclassified Rhodococcus (in: high G+C Gram-positive bacteria)]MBY6413490.1 DUF72 domain-containing protein [Rhodococcus sp. BP-320]MBY6418184.1 DUF72 domain-containing protein [Rhodococcus sp. BP-321]MBY6422335.1 DUF72 domain-containing protein [Rhodococcus sp. BP-324]MBY6428684.1 DUF72 domain-containing protein [Rhodococcus sp. BP-323]MBY6433690.1 DUF72 domain-containing protein [Rhodococcus sp. BP-322]